MNGVYESVRGYLVSAGAQALDRSSVLATAHGAYWRWRFAARAEPVQVRVGGTSARFDVSTRSELVRATELGGERHVLTALLDDLDGDAVVWDVGACVGTYACFLARRVSGGRVVAFEPEPTNRHRLRRNLKLNAPGDRWMVSPFALFDRAGERPLVSEFREAGAGHHYLAARGTGTPVETRRGDDLIEAGVPTPSVLKIDVQGAELRVIDGMGAALSDVDLVYVELHHETCRRYGTTADEVADRLRDRGFALDELGGPSTRRADVSFLRASR